MVLQTPLGTTQLENAEIFGKVRKTLFSRSPCSQLLCQLRHKGVSRLNWRGVAADFHNAQLENQRCVRRLTGAFADRTRKAQFFHSNYRRFRSNFACACPWAWLSRCTIDFSPKLTQTGKNWRFPLTARFTQNWHRTWSMRRDGSLIRRGLLCKKSQQSVLPPHPIVTSITNWYSSMLFRWHLLHHFWLEFPKYRMVQAFNMRCCPHRVLQTFIMTVIALELWTVSWFQNSMFISASSQLVTRLQVSLEGQSELSYLVDGVIGISTTIHRLRPDQPSFYAANDHVVFRRQDNTTVAAFSNGVSVSLEIVAGSGATRLLAASYSCRCWSSAILSKS